MKSHDGVATSSTVDQRLPRSVFTLDVSDARLAMVRPHLHLRWLLNARRLAYRQPQQH